MAALRFLGLFVFLELLELLVLVLALLVTGAAVPVATLLDGSDEGKTLGEDVGAAHPQVSDTCVKLDKNCEQAVSLFERIRPASPAACVALQVALANGIPSSVTFPSSVTLNTTIASGFEMHRPGPQTLQPSVGT